MATKETPTNYRVYYKNFRQNINNKIEELIEQKEELLKELDTKYKEILTYKEIYKNQFNIDIDKYKEFVDNEYSTGEFLRVTKGIFINKKNDYTLISDSFNLYDLALIQKKIYDITNDVSFNNKLLDITIKKYNDIVKAYYTIVHKKLILEGQGYAFSNNIGWICIARCIIDRKRKILDYKATKERTKELLEKGARIYNKEEAEWCARNGIKYEAEDKRVFRYDTHCYQIPLIGCKLHNGTQYKLEISDYRHSSYKGKTNTDLINDCNRDVNKICELSVDLKTKLVLCNQVDKNLYIKFIRNENQKPITFTKTDR